MGKGFTIAHGCITHPYLNSLIESTSKKMDIPFQIDVTGGSTGTDAMAGVLSSNDVASTSIGYPIRNMHTSMEHSDNISVRIGQYTRCTLGHLRSLLHYIRNGYYER